MPSAVPSLERIASRVARALPRRLADFVPERPIVSFTFDDAPQSSTTGARILERYNARGTFYISGALAGGMHDGQAMLDADECRALAEAGHELACHTYSHRRPREQMRGFAEEIERNAGFLAGVAQAPRNFAFPYGLTAPWMRPKLKGRFRTSRGVSAGINRRRTDLDYLDAVEIRPDYELSRLGAWIDDVAAQPGWLIYFTHDVSDAPSTYGCRSEVLDALVGRAVASGCEVLTVDRALDRLAEVA